MKKRLKILSFWIDPITEKESIDKRSLTGQIEHWAQIGKCAGENPDLPSSMIKDILIGLAELEQG